MSKVIKYTEQWCATNPNRYPALSVLKCLPLWIILVSANLLFAQEWKGVEVFTCQISDIHHTPGEPVTVFGNYISPYSQTRAYIGQVSRYTWSTGITYEEEIGIGTLGWISSGLMAIDGSFIISGSFTDTLEFPDDTITAPQKDRHFMYLSKIDQNGQHEWTQTLKGASPDWSYALKNAIYVTGTVRDTCIMGKDTLWARAQGPNPFVSKFSVTGACHWGRQIQVEKCFIHGADSFPGGICVVGGVRGGSLGLGGKEYAISDSTSPFLWVIDTAGQTQWIQLPGYGEDDTPNFLDVIYSQSTKQIYVAGNLWNGEIGRYRPCLRAYDLHGKFRWQKTINSFGRFLRLGLDSAGNIYFTGFFSGEALQIDGIAAHKNSLENEPTIFVGKLDLDKRCEWLHTLRTTGSQWVWDLKVTDIDKLYLAVNCYASALEELRSVAYGDTAIELSHNLGAYLAYLSTEDNSVRIYGENHKSHNPIRRHALYSPTGRLMPAEIRFRADQQVTPGIYLTQEAKRRLFVNE